MRHSRPWPAIFLAILALAVSAGAHAQSFSGDFSLSSGAVYQTAMADEVRSVAVDTISLGGPYVYVTGDNGTTGATVKLSSAGVALASAPFIAGGTGVGRGVAVDPGGNVWVAGYSVTGGGSVSNWVVSKYDPNLILIGTSVISGIGLGAPIATSLGFDASGNAFVAGYSSRTGTGTDFQVMKYSPTMVVLASATLGGAAIDQAFALAMDASGNVILTGDGISTGYDWWTVKLSSSLVMLSSAVYDSGGTDRAYAVTTDPAGNIYVTGESNNDLKVIKYNPSLGQTATVGYASGGYDAGNAAMFVGASTLVVVGGGNAGANEDWLIFEYDTNLALISSRAYDSGGSDRPFAVAKGTGSYMYAAGLSAGDYRTIRLNVTGASAGALAPAAPSGFTGTAQSSTSILWSWTDASADETGFRVKLGPVNVSGDLAANATTWLQTGLTANASTGSLSAQAFNAAGTADSLPVTRYTLSDPPNSITATFFGSSVAFTWPTMTNPPNTRWSVERGTDGVNYSQLYFSSGAAAFTDTGLGAATTYYYRVRSANQDGAYSFYANSSASLYTGGGVGYPGCAATNNVGAGLFYTTIQAAINALPSTLAGNSCVVVQTGTYPEQVMISGINTNGYRLRVSSAPGAAVVVAPASGTAFTVRAASVTLNGLTISMSSGGVFAAAVSSPAAILDGLFIDAAAGAAGGVEWLNTIGGLLTRSSVTVRSPSSYAAYTSNSPGAVIDSSYLWNTTYTAVYAGSPLTLSNSKAGTGASLSFAVYLPSSGNLISQSFVVAPIGRGVELSGSANTIDRSTITTNVNSYALYANASTGNVVSLSYIANAGGVGAGFLNHSNGNSISQSTITSGDAGSAGLYFHQSSSNSIADSVLSNPAGGQAAFLLSFSSNNSFVRSRLDATGIAAWFNNSSSNTLSQSWVIGSGSYGLYLINSNLNTVAQSTLTATSSFVNVGALFATGSSSNVISQSYLGSHGSASYALSLTANSNGNSIDQSVLYGGPGALFVQYSASNSITNSSLRSTASYALYLDSASYNSVSFSTLSASGSLSAAHIRFSTFNQVTDSYLSAAGAGASAALLAASAGNVLTRDTFASAAAGNGLSMTLGADANAVSASTITGGRLGIYLSSAGSTLALDALNFSGLAAGATALSLGSGPLVSTFTGVQFSSAVSGVNADASALAAGSRITMAGAYGPRAGPCYADDPNGRVEWQGYNPCVPPTAAPTGFSGAAQTTASILWTWTDNASYETGYRVLSGTINVSGDLGANATTWLQTGLGANGVYGPYTASAFNAVGSTGSAAASRATLAAAPSGLAASGVHQSSATLAWNGGGNPAGTVFELERSTGTGFGRQFAGAATTYFDASLTPGAAHDYRVRAVNADSLSTAYTSTITVVTNAAAPAAPSGFAGNAQTTTSILWSWADNSSDEAGFRIMAGATNVSGDLPANATTWLQAGLGVNTSSGSLLVQVFNATGTANSGALTRYTLAAAPSGLASSGVFQTSATVTWTAGNPAGTIFELERSTGGGFALVSASSLAAAYTSTGLYGGTTYYFRVRALNGNSTATAYSSSFTLTTLPATLPAAPSGFAGAVQTTTSVLWSWTDNAVDETGYRIIAGASNISGNLAAGATTWLQTGLAINSSAGALFVQAFNSTGTANSGSAARYSLAAAPTGLAAASVHQTSATVTWTSGNPAETVFEVERSTGGAFSLVSASSLAAAYTNTGLAVTSTYYYRVRARNQDNVATAYTSTIMVVTSQVPVPVVPTGFAGTALSPTAIQWSWTDNTANESGYRVLAGTISLSGDLPANASTWLQTGLAVNAPYGPYAALAFNGGGTAVSTAASRTTLAAVPGAPTAAGVYQTSATVNWSPGGNPAGTTFRLERSTGTGYGQQFSGTATSYFDPFLAAAATHYYRVLAVNGEGVATAYAATTTVVALPPPPLPGAAGTPVGAALGISSVTWTWVLAAGATNHNVFRASDNSYLGSSTTGPFVQTALTPNTAYGLRVAGANAGGMGPLSPSASVYTLAAAPSGGAAAPLASTGVFVSWGLNGNAAGTFASLERSSDAVSYGALASGALTSYVDAGLLGCTTYYYRVRNRNGDGLFSAYSAFSGVTANTTAGPPSGLSASANAGGTISLSWGLSGGEGVTGYRLYWDAGSGSVSYGAPIAVLTSTETAFTTGVLASSASYTFALRTAHRCGLVETTGALAMSGAAVAPPPVRAVIKEPDSGRRISGNRITILGELISGTPNDVQQVLFQYKVAASTAWLDVGEANLNHENPDFSFPYFVHVDVTVLAAGAYDLRAVAYDRNGVPDAAPPAVRVVVDPVTPDISETATGDGKIKKDQTVSNAVTNTIETAGAGASDPAVRVSLPPGVVTAATATVSVIANPTITTAAPSGQALVGSAIKIDLSNGQTALNGTATITLTYPDTVRFPSLLQIYYLNEVTGQWSRDFATIVDTSCRTVRGLTPHFSTFALMLGTAFAADLDSVQVYPVPFKPNGPNPDEGRPFTTGDSNSGIVFANLASGAEIKIYTLTGRLVSSIGNPSVAGTVRWDARNQDGRDVASGAYFAVISAPGHKAVVKKLVIIR